MREFVHVLKTHAKSRLTWMQPAWWSLYQVSEKTIASLRESFMTIDACLPTDSTVQYARTNAVVAPLHKTPVM